MKLINRENTEHYNWKKVCVGWHCITTDELSVIAEKIPPHTEENMHFHHKTIFIFFRVKQ